MNKFLITVALLGLSATTAEAKGVPMNRSVQPAATAWETHTARQIVRRVERCVERAESTQSLLYKVPNVSGYRALGYDDVRNICLVIVANQDR